jgi:hypothetical protein
MDDIGHVFSSRPSSRPRNARFSFTCYLAAWEGTDWSMIKLWSGLSTPAEPSLKMTVKAPLHAKKKQGSSLQHPLNSAVPA